MEWKQVVVGGIVKGAVVVLAGLILAVVEWCRRKLEAWEERRKEK